MRFQNAIRNTFLGAAAILSTAASAATLSVSADKLTYLVGETITLSVSGDGQGASSYGIQGRLQYSGSGSVTPQTQTQKKVGFIWVLAELLNGPGFSQSFAQFTHLVAEQATDLPANNPFSTVTLIASAIGVVDVNWNTQTGSGFELQFFGLTNAPGTSFTIVPEPGTVALIALGLLGLAGWRRAPPNKDRPRLP